MSSVSTSSDTSELLQAFELGRLVRPSPDVLNIVDFSNALASLAGVDYIELTSGAKQIAELIGEAEQIVFVLVDGFGMNFVKEMKSDDFVPNHVAAELVTVFPSTTPVVETTLATGKWPGEHAVTGWETYIPEIDADATIIKFLERKSDKSLSELGLSPEVAYPFRSQLGRVPRDYLALLPDSIVSTVYSDYWNGGKPQTGYKSFGQAVATAIQRVAAADRPTFTYIYTSQVDFNAHQFGAHSRRTKAQVREVDAELERLARHLPDNATLVVTADHGIVDARKEEMHQIGPSDELLRCLTREPSGDQRVKYFDVKEDELPEFESMFRERFGKAFYLISTDDAERTELFGPGVISATTKARLGNIMAISKGADILGYRWAGKTDEVPKISHHSGLGPDEMMVPLVIS